MINIKKFVLLIMCLILGVLFIGCSGTASKDNEIVLCNYYDMDIPDSVSFVSVDELNTALSMYAYALEIEEIKDYNDLTDAVVNEYIGYETVKELKEEALYNMIYHRVTDYVYEKLLTNSGVSLVDDRSFNDYYTRRLDLIEKMAKENEVDKLEYITNEYKISESEYQESELDFFITINLLKELLRRESYEVTDEDVKDKRAEYASEEDVSIDDTRLILLDEDIMYIIAEERTYELISEWYEEEVERRFGIEKELLGI